MVSLDNNPSSNFECYTVRLVALPFPGLTAVQVTSVRIRDIPKSPPPPSPAPPPRPPPSPKPPSPPSPPSPPPPLGTYMPEGNVCLFYTFAGTPYSMTVNTTTACGCYLACLADGDCVFRKFCDASQKRGACMVQDKVRDQEGNPCPRCVPVMSCNLRQEEDHAPCGCCISAGPTLPGHLMPN